MDTFPIKFISGKKKIPTNQQLKVTENNIDPFLDLSEENEPYFTRSKNDLNVYHLYIKDKRSTKHSYCVKCAEWFNADGTNLESHVNRKHKSIQQTSIPLPRQDQNYIQFKLFLLFFILHQIPLYSYDDPIIMKNMFPRWPRFDSFINLLHQTADQVREYMVNEFSAQDFIGVIADGWTDMTKRRFLGIGFYFLQSDGTLINRFVKFASIKSLNHTAKAISKEILKAVDAFCFEKDKLKILASDSCSTMTKTANLLHINWVPCYLHLFNLCFNSFWEAGPNIAKDCIKCSNALQKRPKFVEFLENLRKTDERISKRNIATFTKTRWISLTSCVMSILALQSEIIEFFRQNPIENQNIDEDDFFVQADDIYSQQEEMEKYSPITVEHIDSIIDIGSFMKSVSDVFDNIRESLIFDPGTFYSNIEALYFIINNFKNNYPESKWITSMITFQDEIEFRFLKEDNSVLHPIMILHVLDLNHRITRLFSDEFIDNLKQIIKNELINLFDEGMDDNDVADTNYNDPISEFEQAMITSQTFSSDVDIGSIINDEVESFLRWKYARLKSKNLTKLNWFKDGIRNTYPNIFKLVKHYRMFMGTTVSVENAFSISRRILRWDRMRLSREKVDELMLLTMNPDITVKFLAPQIADEFIKNYNKKKYGIEEIILSVADQFDRDESIAKFFLPTPNLNKE